VTILTLVLRLDTTIKPIPPKNYDGAADLRSYHRFVMEGEAYLRDGRVQKERKIRILAHYLDGKAYQFYMQKVAPDDPHNWSLHEFITELFNHCFPVDYRQRMRLKLEGLYQKHNQPVSEYVFELQELFSMVGAMPDEMKVIKLWYSLNTRTQKAMWRDGLHPDSSTWDEVVAKAEILEIADNVVDRREGIKPQTRKNWQSNGPDRRNHDSASRSMTYTNRNHENHAQHSNQTLNSTRPSNQTRQGSGRNFRKKPQGGNSTNTMSRPSGSGSSSSIQRKPVKPPSMPAKEMAQLRADGKCFNCKEVGHMSRNCPHRNTITGSGNNKPPGLPSFGMSMNIIKDDDHGDILESMPVGVINVENNVIPEIHEIDRNWRKWYPIWQNPLALAREQIGNCYEMTAEYLLTIHQPYPGDTQKKRKLRKCPPYNRFKVKEIRGGTGNFRVYDKLNRYETIVNKSLLKNPKFNVGHWYAKKRARVQRVQYPTTEEYLPMLEDPIALVTNSLLQSGVHAHFPNTKSSTWTDDRFFVHLKDYGSTTYVIIDDDLDLRFEIDLAVLENPKFDLIGWYLKQIKTDKKFYKNYLEHHQGEYQNEPKQSSTLPGIPMQVPIPEDLQSHRNPGYSQRLSVLRKMSSVLEDCAPYPGDEAIRHPIDPTFSYDGPRFDLDFADKLNQTLVCIYDRFQGSENYLSWDLASWDPFSLGKWLPGRS
jgi:hypothetical protein